MREWNLKAGDPLSLTLAADSRLATTDYCNDQIWELSMSGGEPPGLALQTTYGLRARSLRLFTRFTEGDKTVSNPADFTSPPAVRSFYPNFLRVAFSPYKGIDVIAEYWVPGSQAAVNRLSFWNRGETARQLRLEFVAQLNQSPDGQRMAAVQMSDVIVLAGQTGDLAPVVFLTGGPQAGTGSYPSLVLTLDLPAKGGRQVTCAHAALGDAQASFDFARQTASRNFEAERARIELLGASQVEVHTGDPDWDAAFALSQKTAYGLLLSPTEHLPQPSFVQVRGPDQGYSMRGDGRDYNHLWNGQTPFDAYYLVTQALPAAPQVARGLLENFLAVAQNNGPIDWKPGLGGQRSQVLATPLLATLAWQIYQDTQDQAFLEKAFQALLGCFQSWFWAERDRDGDGIPEWNHTMQSGFEDHPLFAYWQPTSQGADISSAESPSLCTFLYHEGQVLIRMANLIDKKEALPSLQALCDNLRTALEISWDSANNIYHYWDRDTHFTTEAQALGERCGAGEIILNHEFDHPVRLLVHTYSENDTTRRPDIYVHGVSSAGQHLVEHIQTGQFRWSMGGGLATGERTYRSLERVIVEGLPENDRVILHSVGFTGQDQTLLLPLWAKIPDAERAKALKKTITAARRFWSPYGIRACPASAPDSNQAACQGVYLPWNAMIGEGMLAYGFRKDAALLVTRLMGAVVQSLKREGAFRRYYSAENGQGMGERNALEGLAPLGLFLNALGVRLISPYRVILAGNNPFPWPVTVKYRGLTVFRQSGKTMVVFPDGQMVHVKNENKPRLIALQ